MGEIINSIQLVKKYQETDSVSVLPKLAEMDRKTTGWLSLYFFNSFWLILSLFWQFAIVYFFYRLGKPIITYLFDLIITQLPIWRISPTTSTNIGLSIDLPFKQFFLEKLNIQSISFILIAWFLAGVGLVYFSVKFKDLISSIEPWPDDQRPLKGFYFLLQFFRWVNIIIMALWAVFWRMVLISPILRGLVILGNNVQVLLNDFSFWKTGIVFYWRISILVLFGLVFIVFLFRKSESKRLIWSIVIFLFLLGTIDFLKTVPYFSSLNEEVFVFVFIGIFFFAILFSITISKLFNLPFLMLRSTFYQLYMKTWLRIALWKAIRHHKKRNSGIIGHDAWNSVCKEHMVRCTTKTLRRSYRRPLRYGSCPICDDDTKLYQGVKSIAVKIDVKMERHLEQIGPTLIHNGLLWSGNHSDKIPHIFDVILVDQVEEHHVEQFITAYQNAYLSENHKSLKQIPARVYENSNIGQIGMNLLSAYCNKILPGYDPDIEPNAAVGNIKVLENIQKGKKKVVKILQTSTILVIVCGLFLLLIIKGNYASIAEIENFFRNLLHTVTDFDGMVDRFVGIIDF